MKRTTIVALLALLSALSGCGILHPQTKIWGGPLGWGFSDSKDNNVQLRGARFNPETGEFGVDELVIDNNASKPITANIEQLRLVNEQMRIHGENIAQSLGLITALMERALPGLKVSGPLGGSASASNAAIEALLKAIGDAQARPAAETPPANR